MLSIIMLAYLHKSSSVKSNDVLRDEKEGQIGLKGAGGYNPATGRRTRIAF